MATYNFAKSKEKNLDDTHTNMRLKEQHTEKAPEVVTEKQLNKDHKSEVDVTIERQLEKARTGSAEVILEKNLNDSKGMFGSKHRNSDTSKGDINKLEEKRLSGKNTEGEKYIASSETPKKMRWWDGLKKAKSATVVKVAGKDELEFGDYGSSFERLKDMGGDEGSEVSGEIPFDDIADEAEQIGGEDVVRENSRAQMVITKNKESQKPLPNIYMELSFDPSAFRNDVLEMKEAALEKVLEVRPNLSGKIGIEDFTDPKDGAIDSTIKLRLIGPQYFAPIEETPEEMPEADLFSNFEPENTDVGGTPMNIGRVTLGVEAKEMDEDTLKSRLKDFIFEKAGYEVPEESIAINMDKMEATYAFSDSTPEDETDVADETDVTEPSFSDLLEDETDETGETGVNDEVSAPAMPEELKPSQSAVVASGLYDFPITIADFSGSKKK